MIADPEKGKPAPEPDIKIVTPVVLNPSTWAEPLILIKGTLELTSTPF